jgi:hypothetical protein
MVNFSPARSARSMPSPARRSLKEIVADEDRGYLARVPEPPGCLADVESIEEALSKISPTPARRGTAPRGS